MKGGSANLSFFYPTCNMNMVKGLVNVQTGGWFSDGN